MHGFLCMREFLKSLLDGQKQLDDAHNKIKHVLSSTTSKRDDSHNRGLLGTPGIWWDYRGIVGVPSAAYVG